MRISFHKNFEKKYRKLPENAKTKFKQRLTIFMDDEFHPILNNHSLIGKYQGYRSINVTGDIRAIYKKIIDENIFVTIGSHSELYD